MQTEDGDERQALLDKAQRDLEGLGFQAGHAELIAGLAVELKLTKRRLVELEEAVSRGGVSRGELMARVGMLEINAKGGQVYGK